jgi:hypothetical protein
MSDFLDEKREEIARRLDELKPFVEEYARLAAAVKALEEAHAPADPKPTAAEGKTVGSVPARPKGSHAPGRPQSSRSATSTRPKPQGKRRAGLRKASGTRAAQALSFVQTQPGITIPELAARMGIKQNYLYRVLPALQEENKVAKRGRGWCVEKGWDPDGP